MADAELRFIGSIRGHPAGSPGSDPGDIAFLDEPAGDLLAR